jgi:hypothetical protein
MASAPKLIRIRERPDPSQWADDELLTLAEAAALMWPNGPLKTASLRTAARDGLLPVAVIAGKILTTKIGLRSMSSVGPRATRATRTKLEPLSPDNFVHHLAKATSGR